MFRQNEIKGLRVASFFSGIGGFDYAFEKAGMKVVFQSEINKFCRSILIKHWPGLPLNTDINLLEPEGIPEADLWCGGFPCQDLSLANQGKRKGLNGTRSGLFYKFSSLAGIRRPRWIILENVPGLLNSNNGEDFRILLETLGQFGYCISWRILDAKYFGTPQRRRRVYVVASYRNYLSAKVLFEHQGVTIAPRAGLGQKDLNAKGNENSNPESNIFSIQHASIGRKPEAGPQAKGYRNDGETYTLDSRGSSDVVCKTNVAFGIRESSRISTGVDSNRYRAIGNAVAVPVVYWIGQRIALLDRNYSSSIS